MYMTYAIQILFSSCYATANKRKLYLKSKINLIDVTLFFIFLAYSIISWAVNRKATHSYDVDTNLEMYGVY